MNKQLQIITNYFQVNINSDIYKYELYVDNGVINDQMNEITQVLFKNKEN